MRYRSKAGFTLFELIVVLFILTLAVSLVMVSFTRIQEKTAYKDSVRVLMATLRHCRDMALMERLPVSVKVGEDETSYWVEKKDVQYGERRNMPEGMEIRGEPIVFFPKGNSTGGELVVKYPDGRVSHINVDKVTGVAKFEGF